MSPWIVSTAADPGLGMSRMNDPGSQTLSGGRRAFSVAWTELGSSRRNWPRGISHMRRYRLSCRVGQRHPMPLPDALTAFRRISR
jgi:hypothetical protein